MKINAQKLTRLKQLEGVYVLKTNLAVKRCPTAKALSTYKEQSQVERQFHHLKGPLAVAPMFAAARADGRSAVHPGLGVEGSVVISAY